MNESPNGSSSITLFDGTSLGVIRSICVIPRWIELSSCSKSTRSATDSGDFSHLAAAFELLPPMAPHRLELANELDVPSVVKLFP